MKPTKAKRTEIAKCRLTEDEKNILRTKASKLGMSESDLMRYLILNFNEDVHKDLINYASM